MTLATQPRARLVATSPLDCGERAIRPFAQRGVAAVTAILIVAMAAATATVLLAQQSATLNQAALVSGRAQADAFSRAGLEWARGILAEDARRTSIDALNEPWAQPIAGLPVERAVVSGAIADAQGRFNLNNMVRDGRRSDADVATFRRLLEGLGLDASLADAVVDWIDADSDLAGPGGAEDAYYLALPRPYRAANQPMLQVEELYRVRGFDRVAVARLAPHVSTLPGRTLVNVNTASREVLAALLSDVPPAIVGRIVARRAEKPFASLDEMLSLAEGAKRDAVQSQAGVRSDHFLVAVRVEQDEVLVGLEALMRRGGGTGGSGSGSAGPGATTGTTSPVAIIWARSLF